MAEPKYETIRPRTRILGRRVVHLATTSSTMDEARRLAQDGADSGTVVVADEQTAGRGRAERAWHSPPGSLYATVLLRNEVPLQYLPLLPLFTGLAVAEAIEKLVRIEAGLKWPNDVWIRGKKVAGALIETRLAEGGAEHVLIGIGVNGDLRLDQLPQDLRSSATSLSIETGRHVCMPALLKLFLERLHAILDEMAPHLVGCYLDEVRRRSVVLGKRVRVETPDGPAEGIALKIADQGELLVDTASGPRIVNVGDCQLLRPIP